MLSKSSAVRSAPKRPIQRSVSHSGNAQVAAMDRTGSLRGSGNRTEPCSAAALRRTALTNAATQGAPMDLAVSTDVLTAAEGGMRVRKMS